MVQDTADWLGTTVVGPQLSPVASTYGLIANGTTTIVAGQAGLTFTVHTVVLQVSDTSGAVIQIRDTSGMLIFQYQGHGGGFVVVPLYGLKLAQGAGIQAHNATGVAQNNTDAVYLLLTQA